MTPSNPNVLLSNDESNDRDQRARRCEACNDPFHETLERRQIFAALPSSMGRL